MFDALGDKLQAVLGGLRSRGTLDEETISKAMREIRLALLEADVNLEVVKELTARIKERALGQEVMKSLTPGQQVVKIVHEELTRTMGGGDSRLVFAGRPPTVILLVGLQGSGKTTAAGKLALMLRKDGRAPLLVAADLQRPAAVTQLEQLGRELQVPVASGEREDPVAAARAGVEQARTQGKDVVIVDTAGRLQIDDALMDELARIRDETTPHNVLLVLDAMTGQEAVAVALAFQERVAFDGVVLTKLDGDARGGAALSVREVTGKPIKLASVGEKLDQLEVFHPDRMASRILGMGDVLTLIEKAEEVVEEEDKRAIEQRLLAGEFYVRRLPPELADDAEDGAAPGRPLDGARPRQAAQRRRRRRARARPHRSDHPLDDARRAAPPGDHRRLSPQADRGRERLDGPAGEPAALTRASRWRR